MLACRVRRERRSAGGGAGEEEAARGEHFVREWDDGGGGVVGASRGLEAESDLSCGGHEEGEESRWARAGSAGEVSR